MRVLVSATTSLYVSIKSNSIQIIKLPCCLSFWIFSDCALAVWNTSLLTHSHFLGWFLFTLYNPTWKSLGKGLADFTKIMLCILSMFLYLNLEFITLDCNSRYALYHKPLKFSKGRRSSSTNIPLVYYYMPNS